MKFKRAKLKDITEGEAMFINPYVRNKDSYIGFLAIDNNIQVATIIKIKALKGNFDFGYTQKRYYYKVYYINRKKSEYQDKDFLTLKEAKRFCQQSCTISK